MPCYVCFSHLRLSNTTPVIALAGPLVHRFKFASCQCVFLSQFSSSLLSSQPGISCCWPEFAITKENPRLLTRDVIMMREEIHDLEIIILRLTVVKEVFGGVE